MSEVWSLTLAIRQRKLCLEIMLGNWEQYTYRNTPGIIGIAFARATSCRTAVLRSMVLTESELSGGPVLLCIQDWRSILKKLISPFKRVLLAIQ